uniref:Uncharacterized protein n=1 Tax=Setaria viridis TaxID=4556 RepID=A0A4U6WAY2_SETVI|nr:hypothetical protein SEVIR_1G209400v2 [Setaria viridis]
MCGGKVQVLSRSRAQACGCGRCLDPPGHLFALFLPWSDWLGGNVRLLIGCLARDLYCYYYKLAGQVLRIF